MAVPLPADGAAVPAWSHFTPRDKRRAACDVAMPQPTTRSSMKRARIRPA